MMWSSFLRLHVISHILCRLQDVAAAGQQGGWSEQKLQRRLLDQLQPEVACMQPDELLAEFKALQMMVMYNGAGGEAQQQGAGKGKDMNAQTEEFLVQQVGCYVSCSSCCVLRVCVLMLTVPLWCAERAWGIPGLDMLSMCMKLSYVCCRKCPTA
jgi:hypothetical protein